jgi:hypothetical protein
MAVFPRGKTWWYKFYFAGQFIRESSKSTSKTVAKNAETQRRRELEQGFNNVPKRRENRVRQLRDLAEEYLADYRLRFRGVTFAEYAIGHVVRLVGDALVIDIDESTILKYQTDRLKESAAPKSINEEVRFPSRACGARRDTTMRHSSERRNCALVPIVGKVEDECSRRNALAHSEPPADSNQGLSPVAPSMTHERRQAKSDRNVPATLLGTKVANDTIVQ